MASHEVFNEAQINGPKNVMGYPEIPWHPTPVIDFHKSSLSAHVFAEAVGHKPRRQPRHK